MINLRKVRKSLNKTQSQVATEVGISRSLYSMYECGITPPVTRAVKIALALETTVEALCSPAGGAGEVKG